MRVLFVCTANICRSPMAAGYFVKAASERAAPEALAASAGFLDGGRPVHEFVADILDAEGIDMTRKRSQKLRPGLVQRADLILAMTSEHARGIIGRFPETMKRVYTFRHFCTAVIARRPGQSIEDWLAEIDAITPRSYIADDEVQDIPDPIGGDRAVYEELAEELRASIDWMMGCAFPASVAQGSADGGASASG